MKTALRLPLGEQGTLDFGAEADFDRQSLIRQVEEKAVARKTVPLGDQTVVAILEWQEYTGCTSISRPIPSPTS